MSARVMILMLAAIFCLALFNACTVAGAMSRDQVRAEITRQARAKSVPVDLALAIGHVESGFRCNAVGAAGERGPMQVLPRTARAIGQSLASCRSAIQAGVAYLSLAWAKARPGADRKCRAAMRYNGGVHVRRFAKVHYRYCGLVKARLPKYSARWGRP